MHPEVGNGTSERHLNAEHLRGCKIHASMTFEWKIKVSFMCHLWLFLLKCTILIYDALVYTPTARLDFVLFSFPFVTCPSEDLLANSLVQATFQ